MRMDEILEHHEKVIKALDKKLKAGQISQAEYDEKLENQKKNTAKLVKSASDADVNLAKLMQSKF